MASEIAEFSQFLTPDSRTDVKDVALDTLLQLTGSRESRSLICENKALLEALLQSLDDPYASTKTLLKILINLSSDDDGIEALIDISSPSLIHLVLQKILKKDTEIESLCVLLNNLSRTNDAAEKIYSVMKNKDLSLQKLVNLFCESEIQLSSKVHYLAGFLSNLSQTAVVRKYFMNEGKDVFVHLLPFTMYERSVLRRNGIAGLLRNCCFDTDVHETLLSEDVNILPHLLLPLAGPEEFTEEETVDLPLELQYLGETKRREENYEIRKKLLEALAQLCATKNGRETLRKNQAYLILRELHKWEKEPSVELACESVVQILIRDEAELGINNIKSVVIPEDLVKTFHSQDNDFHES